MNARPEALPTTSLTPAYAAVSGRPDLGTPIGRGVHRVGAETSPYSTGGLSRAYLFEHDEGLTLVDTLWDTDARVILMYLSYLGRSVAELKHIVLTHAHRSHLGGLATLKRLSGAAVYAHETESPIIEGRRPAHGVSLRPLRPPNLIPFRLLSRVGLPRHVPCKVSRTAGEGDEIGPLKVLHTPGHTPGHLALLYDDDVLIAGDAVAMWPRFGAGWAGFNLDEPAYRRSLWRLVALQPKVVGPGHGDPITENTATMLETLIKAPGW